MSVIGGLLLIFGAYYVFKGYIFKASMFYIVADIVWLYNAFALKDYIGFVLILTGTILGILAFLKMNSGYMSKKLSN